MKFPDNPSDEMIFEAVPGLFYQFEKATKTWVRIDGASALGLATPLVDGLMSSDDFKKLQSLIIPPPQSTIKGNDCDITFKSGRVGLFSFDGSLTIDDKLRLRGGAIDTTNPWDLHQNTVGIDFKLDVNKLVEEITKRGHITKVQIKGDQGEQGPKGDDGIDRLNTGPTGQQGVAGKNSTFGGALTTETIPVELVETAKNRAIVDITTQEVSPGENYLVVTRANIGNVDACPDEIVPKDFISPWLLALNEATKPVKVRQQKVRTDECTTTCQVCASSLHYLNFEPIQTALFERFKHRVDLLKGAKEALVRSWLRTMIELFNEQKAALCCALENCLSRTRNNNTRQFIETQRIQAAQANFNLVIDGADDHSVTNMDQFKNCPVPNATPDRVVVGQECVECGLTFKLDAKVHIIDPRTGIKNQSLSGFLPAGTYVASISKCCADLNTSKHAFSGRAAILYNAKVVVGTEQDQVGESVVTFPDFGSFDNEASAQNVYQGVTISFEHAGGPITAWVIDPDGFGEDNAGEIDICVKHQNCFGGGTQLTAVDQTGFGIYVYRGDIRTGSFLGSIHPFVRSASAIDNYGLAGDNAHLVVGPTLEEKKAKIFFFEGLDGLSFFYVANIAGGSFSTNINSTFEIDNNPLSTSVQVADGQLTVAGKNFYGGNWTISGDTEGGVIGFFDLTALWSLVMNPVNLGSIIELDAVSADGKVIILAFDPNGIGGQVSGISSTDGIVLTNPCDVPDGFGPSCGMAVANGIAGQTVYVRKRIIVGATTIPEAGACGDTKELASDIITHGPNPPGLPVHPDLNPGLIFSDVQAGFPGPGPYKRLLSAPPITLKESQTLSITCKGIVDSYADYTQMHLVDDKGVQLAFKQLDHTAFAVDGSRVGRDGDFTSVPFEISATQARNSGETVQYFFEANYGTLNGHLSGSILRTDTKLTVSGVETCPPTVTDSRILVPIPVGGGPATPPTGSGIADPTIAPTFDSETFVDDVFHTTSWRGAYTYALAGGGETKLSPSTFALATPPVTVGVGFGPTSSILFDFGPISLPPGVVGINYYIQGPGADTIELGVLHPSGNPFLFAGSGSGAKITFSPPSPSARKAPA